MKKRAKEFIKQELNTRKISYVKLSKIMEERGYNYSSNTIRTKIHRGSFSFAFFLEVCESLDMELICLEKNNILD